MYAANGDARARNDVTRVLDQRHLLPSTREAEVVASTSRRGPGRRSEVVVATDETMDRENDTHMIRRAPAVSGVRKNSSTCVGEALRGAGSALKTRQECRHFLNVEDYTRSSFPSRPDAAALQKLRNVLPKGRAQAHRLLVHTFRKHDLDSQGAVPCAAFKRSLAQLGTGFTPAQMRTVLRDVADIERSEFVSYGAFADTVVAGRSRRTKGKKMRAKMEAERRWADARTQWERRVPAPCPREDVRVLRYTSQPPLRDVGRGT